MKKLSIILFGLIMSITTFAVPANPRPHNYVQPNGDTLIVRLHGDEHYHWRTTDDGVQIVMNENGYYCYAVKNKNGEVVASKKVAHNQDKRTRCEQRYIAKIKRKYFTKKQ